MKNDQTQHEPKITIKPESLTFEILVNTGNYDNVKFGGTYSNPNRQSSEELMPLIIADVQEQINCYQNRETGSESRTAKARIQHALEQANQRLFDYQRAMLEFQQKETEPVELHGLESFETLLEEIKSFASELNKITNNLFKEQKQYLANIGLTRENIQDQYDIYLQEQFNVEIIENGYEILPTHRKKLISKLIDEMLIYCSITEETKTEINEFLNQFMEENTT